MEGFCAGMVAGIANLVAGHPFDTVKVRLQSEGKHGRFQGPIHCLRSTVYNEGIFALYKGVSAPLVGKGMIHAWCFGVYGMTTSFCRSLKRQSSLPSAMSPSSSLSGTSASPSPRLSYLEYFMCGSITGASSSIIVTPIDQVKAVMQTQYNAHSTRHKHSTYAPAQSMHESKSSSKLRSESSSTTGTTTTPRAAKSVETKRMQTNSLNNGKTHYSGSFDCARQLVRRYGVVNGLYKNIGPTTMEMSGFGVYFSSYEYAKHFFRRRNFHSHCNENNVDDMKGMGESRMGGSGSDNGTGNDRDNGQMYKKNSIINSDAGNHHSVDRRRSNNGDCSDGPNCIYKKALSLSSLPSSSLSLSDEEREALIEQEPLAIHQMMMSGGFAGSALCLVLFPIETIKTKMMTQAKYTSGGATVSTAVAAAPKSYSSITECVLETMRREGVQGFFRGLTPGLLRTIPANACSFLAYELTMNMLNR